MADELEKKFKQFIEYVFHIERKSDKCCSSKDSENFNCPCCNYPTLPERGSYYICPLCFWEDDGQDEPFCEEVWNGPNGDYSLREARNNFSDYLTYYRPDDKEMFEKQKEKEHLKINLIQKFEQLKIEKCPITSKKIKNDIENLKLKLIS
ncbi:MAG: CPCC family cysteine-rich protein [Candidatus Sericytochromatia bacterium]